MNKEWANQSPFAWCERIEDASASPFDRSTRLEGVDFLAEVLRTADLAKVTPEVSKRLADGLPELYEHHRLRKYLRDYAPGADELSAFIDAAEAAAVNLLVGVDDQ